MKQIPAIICLMFSMVLGNMSLSWGTDLKREREIKEDMVNSRLAITRQKLITSSATPLTSKKVCDMNATWREQRAGLFEPAYFFNPKLPKLYFSIGGFGTANENDRMCLTVVKVNSKFERYSDEYLMPPQNWEEVWSNEELSGSAGSIWRGIPPSISFICLGDVATKGHEKPRLPQYRCVHNRFLNKITTSTIVWTDDGMEAEDEDEQVSTFKLKSSGSFVAVNGRPDDHVWWDLKSDLTSKPILSIVDAILKNSLPKIRAEVESERAKQITQEIQREKELQELARQRKETHLLERKRQAELEKLRAEKEKKRINDEAQKQKADRGRKKELKKQQAKEKENRRVAEEAERKRQKALEIQRKKADQIRRVRELGFTITTSVQGKELLNDLTTFVKENPTKIDPQKLAKLYLHAKEETDQAWFPDESSNFKKLVSYLSQNSYFSFYRIKLMKGRLAIIEQRKLSAVKKLKIGLRQLQIKISVNPFGPNALALSILTDKYANLTATGEVENIEARVKNLAASMKEFGIVPKFVQHGTKAQALKEEADRRRQEKQRIKEEAKKKKAERERKKELETLRAKKEKQRIEAEAEKQKADRERQKELESQQEEKEEQRRVAEEAEKKRQKTIEKQRKKANQIRRVRELGFTITTSVEGKELLNDLITFVKKNPSKIDPQKLAEIYLHAKDETDQAWFPDESSNFKKLISYLSQNSYFSSYRMKLMKGRLAIIEKRKLSAIKKIKVGLRQLKMKISVNPFGPNALALSNLTKEYANPTATGEVEDIEARVKNLAASMKEFGIVPKFSQHGTKAQAVKEEADRRRQEKLRAEKEKQRIKDKAEKQRAERESKKSFERQQRIFREREAAKLEAERELQKERKRQRLLEEKKRIETAAVKHGAERKRQQEISRQRAMADRIRRERELGFTIYTSLQGKELLHDLTTFVSKNPTKLDPQKLAELYLHAKEETDQPWFPKDANKFKELVSYLSQNPYFSAYRVKIMNGRLVIIEQRKVSAVKKIKIWLRQIKREIAVNPLGLNALALSNLTKEYANPTATGEVENIEARVKNLAASMRVLGFVPELQPNLYKIR